MKDAESVWRCTMLSRSCNERSVKNHGEAMRDWYEDVCVSLTIDGFFLDETTNEFSNFFLNVHYARESHSIILFRIFSCCLM